MPASDPSKVHGNMDNMTGQVKSAVGSAIGNNEMHAKGEAQKTSGNTEIDAAKAKAHAEAAKEDGKGMFQKAVGTVTGDDSKKTEGDARQAKADVQHRAA